MTGAELEQRNIDTMGETLGKQYSVLLLRRGACEANSMRKSATFRSELTGVSGQTERCCGGLERLWPASGICPAGCLPRWG